MMTIPVKVIAAASLIPVLTPRNHTDLRQTFRLASSPILTMTMTMTMMVEQVSILETILN